MSSANTKADSETKGDWRNDQLSWATMCSQFVLENPNEGDVTFIVGPQKEEIKSFKLFLRVASPVLDRAFSTDWDNSNPISLPDIDPSAFRKFLKLMFTDKIDGSMIKSLELPLDGIFKILYISTKYDVAGITKAVLSFLNEEITTQNALYIYENVAIFDEDNTFLRYALYNFDRIVKEDEFMEAPMEVLAELLKSDDLRVNEVELFKALCRWGKFQFNKKNEKEEDEISGEDLRNVLGVLLPLVRFSLFPPRDFLNQVPKGLLSLEEGHSTLSYMVLSAENEEHLIHQKECLFNVEKRLGPNVKAKVSFEVDSKLAVFTCTKNNKIDVDIKSEKHPLKIHSFRFHGPSTRDNSTYKITVICKIMGSNEVEHHKKTFRETIFRKKNGLFCFYFDPPFLVEPNTFCTRNRFSIFLEGASLPVSQFTKIWKTVDEVEFYYNYGEPGPLAEIEYEII